MVPTVAAVRVGAGAVLLGRAAWRAHLRLRVGVRAGLAGLRFVAIAQQQQGRVVAQWPGAVRHDTRMCPATVGTGRSSARCAASATERTSASSRSAARRSDAANAAAAVTPITVPKATNMRFCANIPS